MLEELDTIRRLTGGSVLGALESAGLVKVRRDDSGQIDRVLQRVGLSAIAYGLLDLGRRDLSHLSPPLSNKRLKLTAPLPPRFLTGTRLS